MKILTVSQIREADKYTIENEPVSSVDLMERAARGCVRYLLDRFPDNTFIVFCGTGNNGGDGMAISRMLLNAGKKVAVYTVLFSDKKSADFIANENRLISETGNNSIYIKSPKELDDIVLSNNAIIIDALIGSGLNSPLSGLLSDVTGWINKQCIKVVSIDIPSGMYGEFNASANLKHSIRAEFTLTFQMPKLALLLPDSGAYAGKLIVIDICLSKEFIEKSKTKYYYVTKQLFEKEFLFRDKFSHKGTYGHSLIISGSKGKMGAAVLASKACMRSGAGLLTVLIPECGYNIMQSTVPEAMVQCDNCDDYISESPKNLSYDSIAIGPGIGTEKETQSALKVTIQNTPVPLIVDADALNILADNKTWLSFLPAESILTPHPKEFERLVGKWKSEEEKLELLAELAVKHSVYVVLKGAHSAIACPDGNIYFNSTGNPGMATGGSGDVLTGIIAGLSASGYTPKWAAILGVYIHGYAGDVASEQYSQEYIMASDIIDALHYSFKQFYNVE